MFNKEAVGHLICLSSSSKNQNSHFNQYDFIKSWILWAYQISKSSIKLYILALNSTLLMNIWRHKACNLTCQAFMYWFNMCILPHREHVKACIFVTLIQSKLILSVPSQAQLIYVSMFMILELILSVILIK